MSFRAPARSAGTCAGHARNRIRRGACIDRRSRRQAPGESGHNALLEALEALHQKHHRRGSVTFEYETRVFLGTLSPKYKDYSDINMRGILCQAPFLALSVILGILPFLLLDWMNPTIKVLVETLRGAL